MTARSKARIFPLLFVVCVWLNGQSAFQKNRHVFYEDTSKVLTDLGEGWSPVMLKSGEVAFIRGFSSAFPWEYDCAKPDAKDWIAAYNPQTRKERVFLGGAIDFGERGENCDLDKIAFSPDESLLYIHSPTAPTNGSLAILNLKTGTAEAIHFVNDVFVIQNGPHSGEIIYHSYVQYDDRPGHHYPFIHARADGTAIREIADDYFMEDGGSQHAQRLALYLKKLDGQIRVNGVLFPARK